MLLSTVKGYENTQKIEALNPKIMEIEWGIFCSEQKISKDEDVKPLTAIKYAIVAYCEDNIFVMNQMLFIVYLNWGNVVIDPVNLVYYNFDAGGGSCALPCKID